MASTKKQKPSYRTRSIHLIQSLGRCYEITIHFSKIKLACCSSRDGTSISLKLDIKSKDKEDLLKETNQMLTNSNQLTAWSFRV